MTRMLGYVALVLATLTGVFLLWQFRSVLIIFVFALALAAAMRRPIDYLAGRGLPRSLAITLTYLRLGIPPHGMAGRKPLTAVYRPAGPPARRDFPGCAGGVEPAAGTDRTSGSHSICSRP